MAERIQTVEPWKRICCVMIGLAVGALAFWIAFADDGSKLAAAFLGIVATFTLIIGAIGWKRPVESVIDGAADLVASIFE